jgi:hypothetical protein
MWNKDWRGYMSPIRLHIEDTAIFIWQENQEEYTEQTRKLLDCRVGSMEDRGVSIEDQHLEQCTDQTISFLWGDLSTMEGMDVDGAGTTEDLVRGNISLILGRTTKNNLEVALGKLVDVSITRFHNG